MRTEVTSDLWWKDAVVYGVDVKTFQDSNGDGIGDFDGLAERLDYLAELGISCLWLLPIMRSPWRDNGYDIADYFDVDRRLGTLGDLVELLRAARERGIRVITDLVVNHTSDEHPWFRAARSSRDNPYRDYYVWRDEPQPQPEGIVFPGEETSNWELDQTTGQYYLHRFYKFQPDLNIENPRVRAELEKIIGLWLELGFSGFRVDAAPFLIETQGIPGKSPDDPHAPLRHMREFLSRRRGDAILLGEANVAADQLTGYFGRYGNELHMLLNFILNQALCLSLAREDAQPLAEHLRNLPNTPFTCQYANFTRSADELSLDRLSAKERADVFAAFAPEERMRLYGRGIRRRLPSMLGGDGRRLELAYSLLFSLPDTPVLLYGEEIGMGEDLEVPSRASVRTAMQWSHEPNGGFSTAERGSTSTPSGTTRTRCSIGSARSSAPARSARSWGSGPGGCWRPISQACLLTGPTGPAAAWPSCITWPGRAARSRSTSVPLGSRSYSPTATSGPSPTRGARSRWNPTAGAGCACIRPANCFCWHAGQRNRLPLWRPHRPQPVESVGRLERSPNASGRPDPRRPARPSRRRRRPVLGQLGTPNGRPRGGAGRACAAVPVDARALPPQSHMALFVIRLGHREGGRTPPARGGLPPGVAAGLLSGRRPVPSPACMPPDVTRGLVTPGVGEVGKVTNQSK
jgi:maltose alpha-D-glucosyltransferase/alpha-amylase